MNPAHLIHLTCPKCFNPLRLHELESVSGRVKEGTLECISCQKTVRITGFIPRFVSSAQNYTEGFGFQWNKHYRTQYDSFTGVPISERRLFDETRWPRSLRGETLLEAGSGSGRFTAHLVATGAIVISFDYSNAVDANYANNGSAQNLLIVQASLYEMPFPREHFDRVLCIGVIQHTPDPEKSFLALPEMLRPGGKLVVDVYKKFPAWKQLLVTKYWVRPFTRRMPAPFLYAAVEKWVHFWWPITGAINRVIRSPAFSWFLLVADYRGVYPLPQPVLREWSVLDSFDMLSPAYDYPQSIENVRKWFEKAGLADVEVAYGANGIEGRATRPH